MADGTVTPEENYAMLLERGYGSRARIGFLSPGIVDETLSRQFYRMAPDGVTLVRTSLGLVEITVDAQHKALDRVEAAARELMKEGPDCIILGGSPTVVVDGFGTDDLWTKRISEVSGTPSSAAQTAAIEGMRLLGMERIVVATPFPDPINGMLKEFLELSGIEVAAIDHLGVDYRSLTHQPLRADTTWRRRPSRRPAAPTVSTFRAPRSPLSTSSSRSERALDLGRLEWPGHALEGHADGRRGRRHRRGLREAPPPRVQIADEPD